MCGRFTLTKFPDEWKDALELDDFELPAPRYNVAPGQYILTIIRDAEHPRPIPQLLHWGLLPSWVKDKGTTTRPINARSETAAEKPYFRAAVRHRRCLVPADGFFEWSGKGPDRRPYYFQRKDKEPFAIAGLWEHWEGPGEEQIDSCTLLTTRPNALVQPLHHRMPVILDVEHFKLWLDHDAQSVKDIEYLFAPYPAEAMIVTPVSRRVNSPRHDDRQCLFPEADERGGFNHG